MIVAVVILPTVVVGVVAYDLAQPEWDYRDALSLDAARDWMRRTAQDFPIGVTIGAAVSVGCALFYVPMAIAVAGITNRWNPFIVLRWCGVCRWNYVVLLLILVLLIAAYALLAGVSLLICLDVQGVASIEELAVSDFDTIIQLPSQQIVESVVQGLGDNLTQSGIEHFLRDVISLLTWGILLMFLVHHFLLAAHSMLGHVLARHARRLD